jgi:hypothetical protein
VGTLQRMTDLRALVLNCTLKPAPTASSSEVLGNEVLAALKQHGVEGEMVRVVDERVSFGVQLDEGDGDGWPRVREKVLAADILVVATPIWLGQPSAGAPASPTRSSILASCRRAAARRGGSRGTSRATRTSRAWSGLPGGRSR